MKRSDYRTSSFLTLSEPPSHPVSVLHIMKDLVHNCSDLKLVQALHMFMCSQFQPHFQPPPPPDIAAGLDSHFLNPNFNGYPPIDCKFVLLSVFLYSRQTRPYRL